MYLICRFIKKRIINTIIGIVILLFGIYFSSELLRILIEDIKCDFGILRLCYLWYWDYSSIHLWVYLLFMFVSSIMIISNKKSRFLDFQVVGLLCFFLYNSCYNWSVYSQLLFVICLFYYYCTFIRQKKNFLNVQVIIKLIIYIFIHFALIITSEMLGITINMAIYDRFGI